MRSYLSIPRILFCLTLIGFAGALLWNHRFESAMWQVGKKHQVDARLLRAVAITESNLNPKAVGAAGEIGMFQIMPNTAKHWALTTNQPIPSEKQLFRVKTNANISAWYIREGLDEYADKEDPTAYALAYYNAGPSRVRVWQNQIPAGISFVDAIPFPSTRRYVNKILGIYRRPNAPSPHDP